MPSQLINLNIYIIVDADLECTGPISSFSLLSDINQKPYTRQR